MFKKAKLLLLSVAMASASVLSLPANSAEQRLPAAKNNSIIQERAANYCHFLGQVFFTVAEMRDKGIDPQSVYNSMLASELPDDIKAVADKIVVLVYTSPELTPDEIGFAIFGQCVEQQTGVRHST